MRTASTMTISAALLISGLVPAILSAQAARPGRTNIKANTLRIDTRSMARQQPAALEALEEHPTDTRTADVAVAPERKLPATNGDYTPAAVTASSSSPYAVALEGNTSWSVANNILNIKVAKVSHTGNGTTGSLRLRLWATQTAYRGGSISGYVLGTYQFQSQLQPGQYYHDVSVNVPFTAPPSGTYYTTLTLEEYLDSGWYIMHYATYDSTSHFGTNGPSTSHLSLQGSESWAVNNNVVTLKVDKVANSGSGTTGSLRLRLWATDTVYGGGTIRGYVFGAYQFSRQLGPNEYFYGINQQVAFTRPPDGTYHVTLTLEEYTGSDWSIRDFAAFNSTTTFGNPTDTASPCDYRDINPYGGAVYGALTSGSCLNSGFRLDAYKFYAVAGTQIQIVMQSPDFYTYQLLFAPNGDNLAASAEGWDDGQTVITVTAPTTGTYYLLATSSNPSSGGPGALGNYSILVRAF